MSRSRRVAFAVAAIWVLAIVDLLLTLREWGTPHFVELNPIAAHVLSRSIGHVLLFKFGMVGLGTTILLTLRRHRIAELASWLLLAVMTNVGLRWWHYFDSLVNGSDLVPGFGP